MYISFHYPNLLYFLGSPALFDIIMIQVEQCCLELWLFEQAHKQQHTVTELHSAIQIASLKHTDVSQWKFP